MSERYGDHVELFVKNSYLEHGGTYADLRERMGRAGLPTPSDAWFHKIFKNYDLRDKRQKVLNAPTSIKEKLATAFEAIADEIAEATQAQKADVVAKNSDALSKLGKAMEFLDKRGDRKADVAAVMDGFATFVASRDKYNISDRERLASMMADYMRSVEREA